MEAKVKSRYLVGGSMLLLLVSLVLNGIFISRNTTLDNERGRAILVADSVQAVKQLLTKEYDETKASLEKYKGQNAELDKTIASLTSELNARKEQIEKLEKDNVTVQSLRRQLAAMKKLRKECEDEMGRISQENVKYTQRIQEMTVLNGSLQSQLNEMEQKLQAAKELKATNFGMLSYRLKKSKAIATSKAKRTHRISVSFDIFENPVADAGQKTVYMIITGPDGKTLGDGSVKFFNRKEGKEMKCSAMKGIDFHNKEQRVTIDLDQGGKLKGGRYKVELYTDGAYGGRSEFTLK